MNIRNERREAAIGRMADHLLREGLAGASRICSTRVGSGLSA